MNKKFTWVFFDLDGTLAESIQALYHIYLDFLSYFNINGTKDEFDKLNGWTIREVIAHLKNRYDLIDSVDALSEMYKEKITECYRHYIKPMVGSKVILQLLRNSGYKIMLVTSSTEEIALDFVKSQKWDKYFSNYVFGNEIERAKPDPEIYRKAIKKAGVCPAAVVVVEDSPNGVMSAYIAGAEVIGLATHCSKEELLKVGASTAIAQLEEIINLLEVGR